MADASKDLTVLDSSIPHTIPTGTHSKSRYEGISSEIEKLHRWHGSSILLHACQLLKLHSYPAASLLYHRCFHSSCLKEYSVWSIAMASLLVACKLEEIPMTARQIISVFAQIFKRRVLLIDCDSEMSESFRNITQVATIDCRLERDLLERKLQETKSMSPLGEVYSEWHNNLLKSEQLLLRSLGFVVYWVTQTHAHRYLPSILEHLGLENERKLSEFAWSSCNDAYRGSACIYFHPEVLACAAVSLAAEMVGIALKNRWWKMICSDEDIDSSMASIAESIDEKNDFVLVADRCFVRSLVKEGAFNDPDQFIWFHLNEVIMAKQGDS